MCRLVCTEKELTPEKEPTLKQEVQVTPGLTSLSSAIIEKLATLDIKEFDFIRATLESIGKEGCKGCIKNTKLMKIYQDVVKVIESLDASSKLQISTLLSIDKLSVLADKHGKLEIREIVLK